MDLIKQEMELVEWMARHVEGLLRQNASSLDPKEPLDLRPEEILTAACDWAAVAFERRVGRFPKKADLSVVIQASIAATHAYLLPAATGMGLLYTFGYTMPCADAVIEQLVALDVVIADIRYAANSRAAKWREAQLRERLGDHYLRIQELGNVNYNRSGSIQLYQPAIGLSLAGEQLQQGQHLAFMCMCSETEGCHREVAAKFMLEQFSTLKIIHL